MPKDAANDLPKATNALGNCLSRLELLHPQAILEALDAYGPKFEDLRTEANAHLQEELDQEISHA